MTYPPKSNRGFTLIELLAVMVIIGILVGLVLGVSGVMKQKAAKSRAIAEIALLESALNDYNIDNGTYPSWDGITGSAVYTGNPSGYSANLIDSTASEGQRSLFEQLVGRRNYDASATANGTQYLRDIKESQSGRVGEDAYFTDPFGFPYGYRFDASASGAAKSIFNQIQPDVWSTGGQVTTPTVDSSDSNYYIYLRWITNWGSN
ncbi:MAG: prepilin-type N-terminal cleavage/methylation domain-containing protein [Verrucomicrobiota bacterium]